MEQGGARHIADWNKIVRKKFANCILIKASYKA